MPLSQCCSSGSDDDDEAHDAAVLVAMSISSSSSRPTALADEDDADDPTNTASTTPIQVEEDSMTSSLLSMRQAAALLIADCLGTGLLALPQNVWILGRTLGLGFLLWNLPINWYAGTLLSRAACQVEEEQQQPNNEDEDGETTKNGSSCRWNSSPSTATRSRRSSSRTTFAIGHNGRTRDGIMRIRNKAAGYSSVGQPAQHAHLAEQRADADLEKETTTDDFVFVEHCGKNQTTTAPNDNGDYADNTNNYDIKSDGQDDAPTRDLIGLTRVLFPHPRATQYQPRATHLVLCFFYTNIFLVLGDYILVMSHAVVALFNDRICLPWAGVLASTLMFALCQLRTMAHLGHTVTALSLTTLAIVVIQCLVADQEQAHGEAATAATSVPVDPGPAPILRQWSALASIAFATGPNKLVLNIRHEMKHRQECPQMLGVAVTVYGVVYVVIVLLAGPNPPSFLFDSIPDGPGRRLAGLLLWIHVAVSYAINSQALCSSMDRLFLCKVPSLQYRPRRRWLYMTLVLSISSYIVANAVPFFKDLLALIGSLTSVPLTLTLPLVLHRRSWSMPIWIPTLNSLASYMILVFSLVFLFVGLVGALGSIELDWSQQGTPFACTL